MYSRVGEVRGGVGSGGKLAGEGGKLEGVVDK